jgi:alpha-beta hydrolase superfamily lysophospholipase
LRYIEGDPLKLAEATASFFIMSRRLDCEVSTAVAALARRQCPVRLFLAEHDRIIDNDKTLAMLRATLKPLAGWQGPARIYPGAHHTLDFEPAPQEFFRELTAAVG